MNGYEFKREIERIFKVARSMCPNITDDMLDSNGAIYYMNGNDSTPFDWNCNNRLCEFYVFHKNEIGFIKAFVWKIVLRHGRDINEEIAIRKGK